jgi:hypothetical protein
MIHHRGDHSVMVFMAILQSLITQQSGGFVGTSTLLRAGTCVRCLLSVLSWCFVYKRIEGDYRFTYELTRDLWRFIVAMGPGSLWLLNLV